MATREKRLAEFDGRGYPPPNEAVEVLCEDHSGTYLLPFACLHADDQWRNADTGDLVQARIIGWRLRRSA